MERPLFRQIGGGHRVVPGIADAQEIRVFQGLLRDEVEVPGRGVML